MITDAETVERFERVRSLCMDLPGAFEKVAHGEATFRAGKSGKMYCSFADHHHDERVAVWLKCTAEARDPLIAAAPLRCFVPPYVGPSGWIGVYLDVEVDWEELADLIEDGYRMVAGKRLLAELDAAEGGPDGPPPAH